ncbi:MAG: MaoC family dehydratase N-terminal domain-containing protein, partial [Actinomycetes bacterium]
MALNQEFVGRSFPPSPVYQVGREKIREFATAIGDSNPVFHDPAAAAALGYADIIAPPTFAIIVSLKAVIGVAHDPDLGLDYARVVHGDQRFVYTRPICAGDELVSPATIENARTLGCPDLLSARA